MLLLTLGLLTLPVLACGSMVSLSESDRATVAPITLEDVPAGACKTAAEYALEAMARKPFYSQEQQLRLDPNSYDCSGLTHAAYRAGGINIGWVVTEQMQTGQRTSCTLADLNGPATTCWASGDLRMLASFCQTPGCHVAIYIKDGVFADCLNSSEGCKLWTPSGYWYETFFAGGYRYDATCANEVTS